MFDEFVGSLSHEYEEKAKILVSKCLLEYNQQYPSDLKIHEEVEIQNTQLMTDWIKN